MDNKTIEIYQTRADIIKAMAHSSRLFIVDQLKDGEKCVCDLTDLVGADTSTVSKHLAILKRAGIIESRKVGLKVFYKLKCVCVLGFFSCVEKVLQSKLTEHQDALSKRD